MNRRIEIALVPNLSELPGSSAGDAPKADTPKADAAPPSPAAPSSSAAP